MPHDPLPRLECRLEEGADALCFSMSKASDALNLFIGQRVHGKILNSASAGIGDNRLRFWLPSTYAGGDCRFFYGTSYIA